LLHDQGRVEVEFVNLDAGTIDDVPVADNVVTAVDVPDPVCEVSCLELNDVSAADPKKYDQCPPFFVPDDLDSELTLDVAAALPNQFDQLVPPFSAPAVVDDVASEEDVALIVDDTDPHCRAPSLTSPLHNRV
jgi:hypothetical protein